MMSGCRSKWKNSCLYLPIRAWGLVFADTYFFQGDRIVKQLYQKKKPPRGMVFRNLLSDYFLSMETVMLRRAALEGLNEWFDPRFNLIEEADLFLRVAHDWELDYVDEPLGKWRIHDKNWSTVYRHDFPKEKEQQLEKYASLYPDFLTAYAREATQQKAYIAYLYALQEWEQGRGDLARQRLRPHLPHAGKYALIYLFSLFPFSLYRLLREHTL